MLKDNRVAFYISQLQVSNGIANTAPQAMALIEMGLYEVIQAKAGRALSAGKLTEMLTQRLQKKAFEGPSSKEDTLTASIEERQDLMGKRMNSCPTSD